MKAVAKQTSDRLNVVLLPSSISYAALLDKNNKEVQITDEMVEEACDAIDAEQVYPFAQCASNTFGRY